MEILIDKKYLHDNPDHIFVFGDNTIRTGYGGAAALRDESNTYGFITKKYPDNEDTSFYQIEEYKKVYEKEMLSLSKTIASNPDKLFLISKLGAGLANKYGIWENVILPNIVHDLKHFENVKFLWQD